MNTAKMKYLTEEEVKAVAEPILRKNFATYGIGDTGVIEEKDFDGTFIIRMTTHVSKPVPTNILIDVVDKIQQKLRKQGEDRFVILETQRQGATDETPDEDVG